MIVRGIDPGSHEIAYSDMDHCAGRRWLIRMAMVPSSDWRNLILGADAVAVERAYGMRISRVQGIGQLKSTFEEVLATNWIACQIVEACRAAGVRVFEVDQAEARRGAGVQFHRAGKAADDIEVKHQIEIILREQVTGWPPGERSSNEHERDAGIYSMHGAYLLECERKAKEA